MSDMAATFASEPAEEILSGPRLYAALDEALERIAEAEAEVDQVQQTAQLRIDKILAHAAQEIDRIQRGADFWRQRVDHLGPKADFGKKKSMRLAFGEFGFRLSPARVEVLDEAKVLEFARANNVSVQVKESVKKADLAALCKIGFRPDPVEDGFEFVPGEESFFFRAGS